MKLFKKKPSNTRKIKYEVDKDVVWYCTNIKAHLMIRGDEVPVDELKEVTCIKFPRHEGNTARCPMCGDVEAHSRKLQSVTTFYMRICKRDGERVFISPDKIKANMALCPICHMWEDVLSYKKYISDMEVRR